VSERIVLYVIGSLELGGAERHLVLVAPQLKKHGWQPIIFCLTARGSQANEVERAGVKVIGPPWEIEKGQTAAGKLFRLLASGARLFALLRSQRPRIVHFFLPAAYIASAPIVIAARVPIRVMSRRSLNRYQSKHPISRHVERLLHRHMQMLLGNSKAVVGELRNEATGTTPIELIYNGVDTSNVQSPPLDNNKNARCDPGKLTLVIVANLIHYKGHADLFRALASIAEKLPASWELLCVGRDDGLGATLSELIHDLNLDPHIRLLGSRTDIPVLLASSDIGILCSHEEGFSNAILEGMAAGLPMVVTDVGGNTEAIIDRKTGFVVPAHDPAALGAAILTLASNPELRTQMGRAARTRVKDHFSLDHCVQRYNDIYRDLALKFDTHRKSAG
jgi:glycosyltransferase involved in cell wall biosynthesis